MNEVESNKYHVFTNIQMNKKWIGLDEFVYENEGILSKHTLRAYSTIYLNVTL